MANKHFTREEAQSYLNWLSEKFGAIKSFQDEIVELNEKIQKLQSGISLNGGGSMVEQISNYSNERDDISKLVEEEVQSIHKEGILVKSVEYPLVDFPSISEDREVYLCWQAGEKEIRYWHEVNVGFNARQAL